MPREDSNPDPRSGAGAAEHDRRRVRRRPCALIGFATSVSQTRRQPIRAGEAFPVTVAEVGDLGARLRTPHELGLSDVLSLTVESPSGGPPLQRRAVVVWTGEVDEQWVAGVEFIAADAAEAA